MKATTSRLEGALGLCRRAGQCVVGATACRQALLRRRALLLLLDGAAGPTTRERFIALAGRLSVPVMEVEPGLIARALGRENARVVAVTGGGFVDLIRKSMPEDGKSLGGLEKA